METRRINERPLFPQKEALRIMQRVVGHCLKHGQTKLLYHGQQGRVIMGQSTGFCLYLKKMVPAS